MRKRSNFLKTSLVAGAISVVGLSSCSTIDNYIDDRVDVALEEFEEEQKEDLRNHAEGILENRVRLESEVLFTASGSSKAFSTTLTGDGYIVSHEGNDYIMTVAHNVSMIYLPFEGELIPTETIDSNTTWRDYELDLKHIDPEKDIAIFHLSEGLLEDIGRPDYDISLGESSSQELFEEAYVIGNPQRDGTIIREGMVASPIEERFIGHAEIYNYGFHFSGDVVPGDSGNIVINSDGEAIGLVNSRQYEFIGHVVPIDEYKENM